MTRAPPLILVVAACAALAVGFTIPMLHRAMGKLDAMGTAGIYREPTEERAEMLQTTWKDADGLTHKVTTTRDELKDGEQLETLHKSRVGALVSLFPPAGSSGSVVDNAPEGGK